VELTHAEHNFVAEAAQWYDQNGAYAHLQGTRPQTPAYALNDSPAGLAAWILEKFRDWSDCGGDLYSRFSRDELLTNVTLYWMTETISSSFRMYYEGKRVPLQFAEGDFVNPPCAIACFPKEISIPPRSWVERGYNVQRWTKMARGGHFAAAEEPEVLAADMQTFFTDLRLWIEQIEIVCKMSAIAKTANDPSLRLRICHFNVWRRVRDEDRADARCTCHLAHRARTRIRDGIRAKCGRY
jgi:hypothetical protein